LIMYKASQQTNDMQGVIGKDRPEGSTRMIADAQTKAAVMAVLDQFNDAFRHRDMERLLALFAPDPDVVLIGTGADEKRVGVAEIQAQTERDWSQSEALFWEWGWTSVSAAGSVAWVAVDAVGHVKVAGQELHLPMRVTAVLEHRGAHWLFLQAHASLPTPEQTEGESFPIQ
jgi:ketosteroid isomerase-like protein